LSSVSETLDIGEDVTLLATPRDATGTALTGRTITWSTSSSAVATVSNGLVTAVTAGLATITATSEGKSASAQITVNAALPASCGSTVTTGRLTYSAATSTYHYVTAGGWTFSLNGNGVVTIINPAYGVAGTKVEFWGSQIGGPEVANFGHENMNGKHIKDRVGDQRTVTTLDGAIITMNANPNLGRVSIYDHDQTHRIDRVGGVNVVTRSCALPFFEETLEADGEASGFKIDVEGYWWMNLYNQTYGPGGVPGPKVPAIVPLGQVLESQPNMVNDYYDDLRVGHT
jgi:hypothetical protein